MATIEEYRAREAQCAADAQAATSDQGRYVARRSEGAWRRLAELGEKREGRTVPVPAVPAIAPKKPRAVKKPKVAKAA
jgi:hypothetical protein